MCEGIISPQFLPNQGPDQQRSLGVHKPHFHPILEFNIYAHARYVLVGAEQSVTLDEVYRKRPYKVKPQNAAALACFLIVF